MLTFPTQAEQVVSAFQAATKTVSLSLLAHKAGGERSDRGTTLIYTFDDDSSLEITGRGKAHRYETFLP